METNYIHCFLFYFFPFGHNGFDIEALRLNREKKEGQICCSVLSFHFDFSLFLLFLVQVILGLWIDYCQRPKSFLNPLLLDTSIILVAVWEMYFLDCWWSLLNVINWVQFESRKGIPFLWSHSMASATVWTIWKVLQRFRKLHLTLKMRR